MYSPQAFPKAIPFYQSANFAGERAVINNTDWNIGDIHLFGSDARTRNRLVSQLAVVTFKRSGILRGEYVVILGGRLALDRNGVAIKIGTDSDDDSAHWSVHSQIELYCATPDFIEQREFVLANWDKIQKIDATTVLFSAHADHNYYHFIAQFLPKIRHFADSPNTTLAMARKVLSLPFQRELLSRTLGSRRIEVFGDVIRVEHPVLVYEPFSRAGFDWVRNRIGLRAAKGSRRIYIERKSLQSRRNGGGIVENDTFCAFLAAHNFERIDFGAGDIPVFDQIKMLEGAGIILSAHGANLTNVGFLEEGVSIIEVLPHFWLYFSTIQLTLSASLNYFGVICSSIDDNNNMVVDIADLNMAFDAASSARTTTTERLGGSR